ncbi:Sodium/hydrogen exchanger family-domain-containing protein, partial [Ochromonadaceae sp. CCMP2298]
MTCRAPRIEWARARALRLILQVFECRFCATSKHENPGVSFSEPADPTTPTPAPISTPTPPTPVPTSIPTLTSAMTKFSFGWELHSFTQSEHTIVSENFLLFAFLLTGSLLLQHQVGSVWKIRQIPESVATMLLAICVGGLTRLVMLHHNASFSPLVLGFSSDLFYFGLLPPILFSSGFHLRRRLFYGNLGAVVALAFVGTCLATAITGVGIYMLGESGAFSSALTLMESLAFGCLLSSTDPISTLAIFSSLKVDPTLFYAVLGESVLNDAVAITAFKLTSRLIGASSVSWMDGLACAVDFLVLVLGSSAVGYAMGLAVAWGFRHVRFPHNKVVPVAVFVCTVYIPFLLSEMLQLSGIVTIFFSGIAARRYVYKNLPHDVRRVAAYVFQLMAHLAETSCFALLGLSVFLVDFPFKQLPFMLSVLGVCILARAATVYPLLGL